MAFFTCFIVASEELIAGLAIKQQIGAIISWIKTVTTIKQMP